MTDEVTRERCRDFVDLMPSIGLPEMLLGLESLVEYYLTPYLETPEPADLPMVHAALSPVQQRPDWDVDLDYE